jgi:transposase
MSAEQEEELNHYFLRSRHWGSESRRQVAKKVGIKESTVFQWFTAKKKS